MPTTPNPAKPRNRTGRRRKDKGKRPAALLLAGCAALLAVILLLMLRVMVPTLKQAVSSLRGEGGGSSVHHTYTEPALQFPYDAAAFSKVNGIMTYTDTAFTTQQGIDVSVHQGTVDWNAVAADGIEFVILRVGCRGYSEGNVYADENFRTNLEGARQAGLQIGVYFYSQAVSAEEAEEEARFAVEQLDGAALELPVYFDWEQNGSEGSRSDEIDYSVLTDCAHAFCAVIAEAGYQPGVYFYPSLGLDVYDLDSFRDYDLWLSEPNEVPTYKYNFRMWQYAYDGQVAGINGPVDRNIRLTPAE